VHKDRELTEFIEAASCEDKDPLVHLAGRTGWLASSCLLDHPSVETVLEPANDFTTGPPKSPGHEQPERKPEDPHLEKSESLQRM